MNDLPEPEQRPVDPIIKRPSTLGGIVYLVVGAATAAGLAIVAFGPWRTGLAWMGVALIVGSMARLMLQDDNAGMLKVRRKSVDVLVMFALGVGLVVLSVAVPNAPV